jgi:type II secretory pathway pseudopilin PulG
MTFLHSNNSNKRASENGSALVYILIAIALLAALTVSFMEPSSQQTSSQNTFKTVSEVQGQIDTIRSAIQECVLLYPNGDSTIDNTTGTGTDPDARKNYPINPNSGHYSTATPAQSGNRQVRALRCPGNPTTGNAYDHASIFSSASGKFMPPAPDLFGEWQYYNGADGVFIWIESTKSDAYIASALAKLDEKYSTCEADVIDATGGVEALDSVPTAGVTCTAGSTCFRLWIISNAATEDLVNVEPGCE